MPKAATYIGKSKPLAEVMKLYLKAQEMSTIVYPLEEFELFGSTKK